MASRRHRWTTRARGRNLSVLNPIFRLGNLVIKMARLVTVIHLVTVDRDRDRPDLGPQPEVSGPLRVDMIATAMAHSVTIWLVTSASGSYDDDDWANASSLYDDWQTLNVSS